ncbi:hypothetical protein AVJ22_04400 [Staphylococcus equorum]|nr:hypothetical protein AVJ22_04400 [Staphylococcus equorum]
MSKWFGFFLFAPKVKVVKCFSYGLFGYPLKFNFGLPDTKRINYILFKKEPRCDGGSFLNLILISLKYFDYNVVKKGH